MAYMRTDTNSITTGSHTPTPAEDPHDVPDGAAKFANDDGQPAELSLSPAWRSEKFQEHVASVLTRSCSAQLLA